MTQVANIEVVMKNQLLEIGQLEMATSFIQNKEELKEPLIEAREIISSMSTGIESMRKNLEIMKEQNVTIKKLMAMYQQLDKNIIHMFENVPQSLMDDPGECPVSEKKNNSAIKATPGSFKKPMITSSDLTTGERILTDDDPLVQDCRKKLFKEPDDCYTIEELSDIEFSKIPKYMIGRQTISTVNGFINTINQIMKFKYGILSLGKVGARKKGELDLFLQFKKEENDLKSSGQGEKIYFFNAEDYQRETKLKLDKTKLNLLTVLRHCKRIHEIRLGKNVKYQVITSS